MELENQATESNQMASAIERCSLGVKDMQSTVDGVGHSGTLVFSLLGTGLGSVER